MGIFCTWAMASPHRSMAAERWMGFPALSGCFFFFAFRLMKRNEVRFWRTKGGFTHVHLGDVVGLLQNLDRLGKGVCAKRGDDGEEEEEEEEEEGITSACAHPSRFLLDQINEVHSGFPFMRRKGTHP